VVKLQGLLETSRAEANHLRSCLAPQADATPGSNQMDELRPSAEELQRELAEVQRKLQAKNLELQQQMKAHPSRSMDYADQVVTQYERRVKDLMEQLQAKCSEVSGLKEKLGAQELQMQRTLHESPGIQLPLMPERGLVNTLEFEEQLSASHERRNTQLSEQLQAKRQEVAILKEHLQVKSEEIKQICAARPFQRPPEEDPLDQNKQLQDLQAQQLLLLKEQLAAQEAARDDAQKSEARIGAKVAELSTSLERQKEAAAAGAKLLRAAQVDCQEMWVVAQEREEERRRAAALQQRMQEVRSQQEDMAAAWRRPSFCTGASAFVEPFGSMSMESTTSLSWELADSLEDRSEANAASSIIPVVRNTLAVLQPQEVQAAHKFVSGLYKEVDPSKNELADNLREIAQRVLGKVLHLQQHLPAKLKLIQTKAEEVRDVLGMRIVDILGQSELREKDIMFVREALTKMQKQLVDGGLSKLLREVQDCERDFAGHQGGYEQSIGQEELQWRKRHLMAKNFGRLYTPAAFVNVTCGIGCGIGALVAMFGAHFSAPVMAGTAACSLIPAGKWCYFGARTDFNELQEETKEIVEKVRDIKNMGYNISSFYQKLKEDIEAIMAHAAVLEQMQEQLPFLGMRTLTVDNWGANRLSAALHGWNLESCALTLLENNISGRAFLHVLTEQDFQAMGITDGVTLRRLQDLQVCMRKGGVILRDSSVGPKLKQALDDIISDIIDLQQKYHYA
ncbi:unnamed protein product, partial [Symbiodinium microadriaticum]